jgi:hypothetical protein
MTGGSHAELFHAIAQTNKLPSGVQWADLVPILLAETTAALTAATQAISPSTDAESFQAENVYILEQLELLHAPPFTLQRLCEVLRQPSEYHTSRSTGALRGEMLQAAIRRCVLVAPTD